MCWFGISEPSQTLISLNSSTLLEINIKSRKAAALLFLTSSNLTRPLCSRNACGTERGLCSLRYQFLSLWGMGVCFLFHGFLFPFITFLFACIRWKKADVISELVIAWVSERMRREPALQTLLPEILKKRQIPGLGPSWSRPLSPLTFSFDHSGAALQRIYPPARAQRKIKFKGSTLGEDWVSK